MKELTFFADECVFGLTIELVREYGIPVIRAQDIGMGNTFDEEIFNKT